MTTMSQDEIFVVLKNLLVERGYLSQKDADVGIWTLRAQTAWESYAYHVLGQIMHFLVPNSKEELTRLGIEVPAPAPAPAPQAVAKTSVETPVKSEQLARQPNVIAPEPKTLSRVINHDADDL